VINRQSQDGQAVSKSDENQLRTYKEHVDQLTTYIDLLRNFDHAYQAELGGLMAATGEVLRKIQIELL